MKIVLFSFQIMTDTDSQLTKWRGRRFGRYETPSRHAYVFNFAERSPSFQPAFRVDISKEMRVFPRDRDNLCGIKIPRVFVRNSGVLR